MAKINMSVDEETVGYLHSMVRALRTTETVREDLALDVRLRDVELACSGALRSVGWQPGPGGRWVKVGLGRVISKVQVEENWREFGRMIVAHPAKARKAMMIFYLIIIVLGMAIGAIIASAVWVAVT